MKLDFIYEGSILNLPAKCVQSLPRANVTSLRVLLALAADKIDSTLAARTGLSEEEVTEAIAFWCEEGVLRAEGIRASQLAEPDDRPAFTGADIERICGEDGVKELLDVCTTILGKTMTPKETEAILYLYHNLRLEFAYIVSLCQYCADIGKPSPSYVLAVGLSRYKENIVTVDALKVYIENEKRKHSMAYRIRKLYGIGERALSEKEDAYLASWVNDWHLPYEVLEYGYNAMIDAGKMPKFYYENGILKKWVDAGCYTLAEIKDYEAKHPKMKSPAGKKSKEPKEIGFDLDEFFNAATLRGEESESTPERHGS